MKTIELGLYIVLTDKHTQLKQEEPDIALELAKVGATGLLPSKLLPVTRLIASCSPPQQEHISLLWAMKSDHHTH